MGAVVTSTPPPVPTLVSELAVPTSAVGPTSVCVHVHVHVSPGSRISLPVSPAPEPVSPMLCPPTRVCVGAESHWWSPAVTDGLVSGALVPVLLSLNV